MSAELSEGTVRRTAMARLRGFVAVLVLAALGVVGWPAAPACACSCVSMTSDEAFGHAEGVFVGTVRELTRSPANPGVGTAIIEVSEVRKGPALTFVSMPSLDNGDSVCAYEFVEGHRYLIFAGQLNDGSWRTGFCTGTMDLGAEPSAAAGPPTPTSASGSAWWSAEKITLVGTVAGVVFGAIACWVLVRRRRQDKPPGRDLDRL